LGSILPLSACLAALDLQKVKKRLTNSVLTQKSSA